MLEIQDLYKAYGPNVAVNGISLSIPRGICYGLLGPNGAGKTTTISVITGTIDPDRGSILLDGVPIGTRRLEVKKRLGYVPQELALYDDLSATENLRFFGVLYGLSGSALERRMNVCLETVGLSERRGSTVKSFSGGMKRRLNIAAALLHEPDFLLLDEPTVGVDPQSRNLIFETLDRLREHGKTLLYTTHYMEEAERLCQRVAIMDSGKIVAEGDLPALHALVPAKQHVLVRLTPTFSGSYEGLAGVASWRSDGQFVVLDVPDLGKDLPLALQDLAKRGAEIQEIKTERPTLEEVFLHLTGKVLRD